VTLLLWAIALVVLGWFIAGTLFNIHRGRELLRWMQGGLPLLGERTTLRWLGSTAVELTIAKAREPFAQVTVIAFFEPRDLPWMWALSRAGGRRDTLIVRGHLRAAPALELEALDLRSWSGKDRRGAASGEGWSLSEPGGPGELSVFHGSPAALRLAQKLLDWAARERLLVRRLSVRSAGPHFELHLALPARGEQAGAFFEAIRSLAQGAHG
jgi:hypothetical protein